MPEIIITHFYTKDATSDDIACVIKTFLYTQKIEFCSLLMFYAKCTQSILHYKVWSGKRVYLNAEPFNLLYKFKNDSEGKAKNNFTWHKLKTGQCKIIVSFDNKNKILYNGEFVYNFFWRNLEYVYIIFYKYKSGTNSMCWLRRKSKLNCIDIFAFLLTF